MVRSYEPVANSRPVGDHETDIMALVCPLYIRVGRWRFRMSNVYAFISSLPTTNTIGSIGFHCKSFDLIPSIVFFNAVFVRVSCNPIPRSAEQCANIEVSLGLYRTVVTVSSLPHNCECVDIGEVRDDVHICTASSLAVAKLSV